jgi:hypothetical protein
MKNLLKGHTAQTIGAHDFIELNMDEYTAIEPIPTNRDSQRRVSKMKNTFNESYAKNQISTLTEVALGIVVQDFVDPESQRKYTQGEWYIIDGNTRKYFWIQYPDKALLVPKLTGKIHYLKSMDDVNFAYYPYNNAKSTEKASEILQGLARRYNWAPRQTVFANGGYKTAIDWACSREFDKANVFEAFNYCFEELKALDGIPKDATHTITKPNLKPLKSQAIIAAIIIAMKIHPNNLKLHDMVERLSTITMDELNKACFERGDVDPVQIIAAEYTGVSTRRSNTGKASDYWLNGHAGSTKFESQGYQMDFLLYWISKYIENPKITYNFNRGVKPEYWQGAWDEFYPEE